MHRLFSKGLDKCISSIQLEFETLLLSILTGGFRELVDINLLGAMGPPGGGRNPLTARFTRHFNILSFCEMEDKSKIRIFSSILNSWIGKSSNQSIY